MSNVKISALPAATTPLTGTELVPLVQSGVTSQVAVSNIKTAPAGSNTQVQFNNAGAFGASASLTWDGTSLTATKLAGAHNGTVGATTPSTGAFTTLSTTGQITASNTAAAQEIFKGWGAVGGAVADNGQIQIGATSTYCGVLQYDSSGNTTLYIDSTYNSNSSKIKIRTKTGGTAFDAITVTGDGSVAMGNGLSVTNTVGVGAATPSTSGAGITFPATQSASTDANTLDDYEEGTWTPVDGSGASLSFTGASGTYTKIGRLVTVIGTTTYPTTASGAVTNIAGLPFTLAATMYPTAAAMTDTLFNVVGDGRASTAGMRLYKNGSNGYLVNSDMSGKYINFVLSYFV
jgi:hypothetical protein